MVTVATADTQVTPLELNVVVDIPEVRLDEGEEEVVGGVR